MSYCRQEGKDRIVFATKEDLDKPCKANIVIEPPKDQPGAVLPDGTINWDCPCISRDLTGPCGYEMRQALSCIQKEAATPECRAKHVVLQECLQANSSLYPWVNEDKDDDEDNDDNGDEEETMKIAENMISEAEEKS